MFRRLVAAGASGLAAGEIGEALGVPGPTLSFHLEKLAASGLVVSTREGRSIRYALDPDAMRAFLAFLSEDCCEGHPELCLPAAATRCAPEESCSS